MATTPFRLPVVLHDQPCLHCGASSDRSHPAGVIVRRWLCRLCGRFQWEAPATRPQEVQVHGDSEDAAELAKIAGRPELVKKALTSDHYVGETARTLAAEAEATDKRAATRAQLEAEGKRIHGEATHSRDTSPGYPAALIDLLVERVEIPKGHPQLDCHAWWIDYEGQAHERGTEWTKHDTEAARHGDPEGDPKGDARRAALEAERDRRVAARARRIAHVKAYLTGRSTADAVGLVLDLVPWLVEDYLTDDVVTEILGEAAEGWNLDEFRVMLAAYAAQSQAKRLQVAVAVVVESAEGRFNDYQDDESRAVQRTYLRWLEKTGYALDEQEQALLADEGAGDPASPSPESDEAAPSSSFWPDSPEPVIEDYPEAERATGENREQLEAQAEELVKQAAAVAAKTPPHSFPRACRECGLAEVDGAVFVEDTDAGALCSDCAG